MSFSDYLEDELLDHVFGIGSWTAPDPVYIALSTANPTEDGSGLAEPVGGSYVRRSVDNDSTTWNAATGTPSLIDNKIIIEFATATGDWGTITHFAVYDAASGGNMLGYGALGTSKAVDSGDTARFAAGELNITLD